MLSKIDRYYKLCLAISGSITAYHCGTDLVGGSFSLNHLGSGEGLLYLGPGIYFADDKQIALSYARYALRQQGKQAHLYKVSIRADGLYDLARGQPMHLREKSIEMQKELCKQFSYKEDKHLCSTDSFKYGKEYIGFIVEKFGQDKARSMLKAIGINGIYENLPSGALEVCVYDPSIITVIEKSQV
jgi:hypothetical protein